MSAARAIVVDADGHVCEPADLWTRGDGELRIPDRAQAEAESRIENGGIDALGVEHADALVRIEAGRVAFGIPASATEIGERRAEHTMGALTALVGDSGVVWASDFPHSDAKYPGVVPELRAHTEDMDRHSRDALFGGNARRLSGIAGNA